ncbi:MAG TPA: response regulator, partial [Victivallales bacterium]|nr:response regulator [Victivallales bacterium]
MPVDSNLTTQNAVPLENPKKSVLVVDDEENFRILMEQYLAQQYNVTCAEDAPHAEEILNKRYFDIALIDVNMPGMSGKELFMKCSEAYPDMPIILMSGKPMFDDAVETVKHGAYDYLSKPFELKTLIEKINSAIRSQRERQNESDDVKLLSPEYFARRKFKVIRSLGAGNSGVVLLVEKEGIRYAMKILRSYGDPAAKMLRVRRF